MVLNAPFSFLFQNVPGGGLLSMVCAVRALASPRHDRLHNKVTTPPYSYKTLKISRPLLAVYLTVFNLNFRDVERMSEGKNSSERTVDLTSACIEESTDLQEVCVG